MLWTPDGATRPTPLVLVQHGGSGHKSDPSVMELVALLVAEHGMAVAAIDGLIHGERRAAPIDRQELLREFLAFWARDGQVEELVGDWLFVIAQLQRLAQIDADRLGWCGLSMGTAYGLPVVARCPAMRAAVLGKWSANHANSAFLLEEAPRVRANVLFVQHSEDELFDAKGTLQVFHELGTPRKRLLAYPGAHMGRGREELAQTIGHLRDVLGD